MDKEKLTYRLCASQGLHEGELLNMVCLEPCASLCCNLCLYQSHSSHTSMHLKSVISKVVQKAASAKTVKFDLQKAGVLIMSMRSEWQEKVLGLKSKVNQSLDNVMQKLNKYFQMLMSQIETKSLDTKSQLDNLVKVISSKEIDLENYMNSIKQLIKLQRNLLQINQQVNTQSQIYQSITSINKLYSEQFRKIQNSFQESIKTLTAKVVSFTEFNAWSYSNRFRFVPELKHNDIMIIDKTTVKSSTGLVYKFALLAGDVCNRSQNSFSFKIKEIAQPSNNWLAVGLAHKNIIISKNYTFQFSAIGHGAYMISSNGGSWSNIQAENNNQVKAFKFNAGDSVNVDVSSKQKKVRFTKKNTGEKYQLDFQVIADDTLHPCCLFYYQNDVIEFSMK